MHGQIIVIEFENANKSAISTVSKFPIKIEKTKTFGK